ncbi:MAG TPA: helix-turn-helix domain-containing protein [Chthoniobacterales bacterium]|nr:helix-turn-helix domain-containing protein [Chthoniobacterales bacterium]
MTIEGLGKRFQEARLARGLTLDEAARMTKIRPSRLAEIEAEDFSQFPSLAYAKGFLQIYGKFLDVDVTPYLEAFETSGDVTVNGYSYLQENPPPAPVRTTVARRRPERASSSSPAPARRPSIAPLLIGIVVIVVGFWIGKLVVNLRRLAGPEPAKAAAAPSASVASATPQFIGVPPPAQPAAPVTNAVANTPAPALAPPTRPSTTAVAAASPTATKQPEVRRAEPVRAEDLQKAAAGTAPSPATEAAGANRVDIRPLKKTYLKVVVDNETEQPAFERWVSPSDGTVQFRGQHIAVRVLDRDAIQIKKNGKVLAEEDEDVTVE